LRRSLQIALAAALVVLAAGLVFAFTQQGRYKAETSLIVLPANTLTSTDQANFLETLSRGQITATMAEVAQSGRFETEAEKAMGLSAGEAASSTVTVTVVPSTSVLLIQSEANSKATAEGLADRTAQLAATYLKSMIKPYAATQVRSAVGTAYAAGTATWMVAAGAFAAALAVAVAAQQASYQVLLARRRSRRGPIRRPIYTGATAVGTAVRPNVPAPATASSEALSAEKPTGEKPTAIGTAKPATYTSSGEWNSAAGLASSSSDWRSGNANGTGKDATKVEAPKADKADKAHQTDSDEKPGADAKDEAAESGATNERVLFS
jgi:capsular polysaccharide biosynthesis protein